MFEETKGIVLNRIKYTDNSSIVHIYTERFGKLSVIIRHSKSKKSVSKKSILQPLFLLNLNLQYKKNKEIQQGKELNNYPVFCDIPFNIHKSTIAMFLAEILSRVLKEEEANPSLFGFLFHSIQLFDQKEDGIANFHLVFLYELSKFLGFYPHSNYSEKNKYFNIKEGFYTDFVEIPEIYLDEELSRYLHLVSIKGFKQLNEIKLSREQRGKILNTFLKYYQYHLPEMGKIKSLDILSQVFEA